MKHNTLLYFLFGFLLLLIFFPLVIYFLNFGHTELSFNNQDWGNFGDYLNGTLSPVIALIGVTLSFLIWLISHEHNKTIIEKQEMEKRPLANIGYKDFEKKLEINLWNKGLGPLIVTKFSVRDTSTNTVKDSIFDCIKTLGKPLNNYSGNQDNLVLRAGSKINLLLLEQGEEDEADEFSKQRDMLRKILSKLEIEIDYNDIYDNKMKTYKRSLKWFGRHFDNTTTKKGSS